MVVNSEPELRRHGTGTPPSFTVEVGHFPTVIRNTSSWLVIAGVEPELSPAVVWLLATEGASLTLATALFLPAS